MMIIDEFTIKCDICGMEYDISPDTLDVKYAYDERPMGTEIQHIFCGEMRCRCGNSLAYTITAVEYPEGAYNFLTCESEGCSYLEEPNAEMEYLPEPVLTVYEQVLYNPFSVYDLEAWEFEMLVADVFRHNGFKADVTQRTRDGGKDIVACFEMSGVLYTTYFECKHYAPNRPVGVAAVRELYAVMDRDRVDKGIIVTTSYFTKDAIKEAKMLNGRIHLIDYTELQRLIKHDKNDTE